MVARGLRLEARSCGVERCSFLVQTILLEPKFAEQHAFVFDLAKVGNVI